VNQGVKTATFYDWKYSHYFIVVEESDKNLQARCILCTPSQKTLSSARNTTSNFKKHLDTVHKTMKLVEKDTGRQQKCLRDDSAEDIDGTPQTKQHYTFVSNSSMSATKHLSLISEYVVEDMLPMSTEYSPAFKKLIGGVHTIQVLGQKVLTVHFDKVFDAMNPKLKGILEGVDFFPRQLMYGKLATKVSLA